MNAAARKKVFTVDEANRRLPLVRVIVQDIVDLYGDVHARRERLSRVRHLSRSSERNEDSPYSEEVQQMEDDIQNDINRLEGFSEELQELGVELKDPLQGLVDFRTVVDGREVYLCWKLGENDIAFWHELDAGFNGRQPIFESSLPVDPAGEGQGQN